MLIYGRTLLASVAIRLCLIVSMGIAVAPLAIADMGFSVTDDIGLARFGWWSSAEQPISVSPDRRLVAIVDERGIVNSDRVEDELRVYDLGALSKFAQGARQQPSPIVDLDETFKEGPVISQVRWLPDSTGLAFLLKGERGENQLAFLRLHYSHLQVLSANGQDVMDFSVRDGRHYAYTVKTPGSEERPTRSAAWDAWDGTGQSLGSLVGLEQLEKGEYVDRGVLWAADGGAIHTIKSSESGRPVVIYQTDPSLALSPDGHTLAAALPVANVPPSWATEFSFCPWQSAFLRGFRTGPQDLNVDLAFPPTEYSLIDLRSGAIRTVNGTPTGAAYGWIDQAVPSWSENGKALLLSNIFMLPAQGGRRIVSRPCTAVLYPETRALQCVEALPDWSEGKQGRFNSGSGFVISADFLNRQGSVVAIRSRVFTGTSVSVVQRVLAKRSEMLWLPESRDEKEEFEHGREVKVYVRQAFNEPPVAMVEDLRNKKSRAIWNPNPQLSGVALPKITLYRWTDAKGRAWSGGLYWPAHYMHGQTYPLVIQTHGFVKGEFRPSGLFPTAFAASALAAKGIFVLQTPMCALLYTTIEGRCAVEEYEGAVRALASKGLIDRKRIGIIGFSRSVYWVLDALTGSSVQFAAASITDGLDMGYWQYLSQVGVDDPIQTNIFSSVIGAKPFGAGMRLWLKRSPTFNMQEVRTPILDVATPAGLLCCMWEPYAELRLLGRPVDLVLLNTSQHLLTNPALRIVSQGGTVDWFRFWLQGHESQRPVVPGEYSRWRKLCDMQRARNSGRPAFCVPTSGDTTSPPSRERRFSTVRARLHMRGSP